ncbi:MAG: sulfatase, partial [Actinomycetales bacterium]|nr:sulfatase [Actinomycetales bacterium]
RAPQRRPNFVIIQTDDMMVEDLKVMPGVQALIARQGATFNQMLTPFALCCPSRASMMTGCYPHNTNVNGNFPPDGGFVPWEETNGEAFTAYWLQEAGYHTVHIGKYINGYGQYNRPVLKTPSGWTEWYGTSDPSTYQMYGYRMNEPGGSKVYGDFYVEDPANYGTDVYTAKALGVIKREAQNPGPFMMQVAYLAPHVETIPLTDGSWKDSWADIDKPEAGSGISIQSIPPRPAARHANLLPDIPLTKDPSFNEADRSDKQSFVRNLAPLSEEKIQDLTEDNRTRKLSLLAVDEGVTAIVAALRRTNQLDNTYIIFMGDNGYMLGQHAISYGKYFPYEPALRIPALIRGPGIPRNTIVEGMTFEIDIAPTVLELAGVKATRPIDGLSLVPRLTQERPLPQRTLLLSSGPQQSASGAALPLFDGVRTQRYAWWVYEDGFEEMYDLIKDPYQLESVAYDPAYLKTKLALVGEWNRLKDCQGSECKGRPTAIPAPLPPS